MGELRESPPEEEEKVVAAKPKKKSNLANMFEQQMLLHEQEENEEISPKRADRRSFKQKDLAKKFVNTLVNTGGSPSGDIISDEENSDLEEGPSGEGTSPS